MQFHHVARESVGIGIEIAAQRGGDALVAARRAAQPEVDASGKQRLERAELFGDHQRRMVGQHDPARTHADGAGRGGDVADHDAGRGAGDAFHPVMLGAPVSLEPQRFSVAGDVRCIGERGGDVAAFGDVGEIEQGKFGHAIQDGGAAAVSNRTRWQFFFAGG